MSGENASLSISLRNMHGRPSRRRDIYIDCLWVSGQFKGHGYSNLLLEAFIEDSKEKGKKGLAILSSKKKMGFLSAPKYMSYKGFQTADTAEPYLS